MSKPDDIPQDVWVLAEDAFSGFPATGLFRGPEATEAIEIIARVIMSAEKRGARLDRVVGRICVFRDMEPEEDEDWESWYFAAFDMLIAEVRAIEAQSDAFTNPAPQGRATAWLCEHDGQRELVEDHGTAACYELHGWTVTPLTDPAPPLCETDALGPISRAIMSAEKRGEERERECAAQDIENECARILSKQDGKDDTVDSNLRMIACILPGLAEAIRKRGEG